MPAWMVRAGSGGERFDEFQEAGEVRIGYGDRPDLTGIGSRDELKEQYAALHPGFSAGKIGSHVGQLWRFAREIQEGDLVVTPVASQDVVAIGRVVGGYAHRTKDQERPGHVRPVEWLNTEVSRSALQADLLASLGAIMTVCKLERNNAEARFEALAAGKPPPVPPLPAPAGSGRDTAGHGAEEAVEDGAIDLQGYAADRIRDHITRTFDGHRFAALIDAVLQAQGYTTQLSPPGPDGGVDILAGRGPLGFGAPRLCVQVKRTTQPQDVMGLRELRGVMNDFSAEQGLFVSWGGYKSSVKREVGRRFFEIRLWDASDVIDAVQRDYASLPESIRADLPLKRVWTLVEESEGDG